MKLLSLLATLVLSVSANAASVGDCDYLDSIGNLVEPYKTYANGAIRVAYVSTEEPAAAPDHFLVFIYGDEMDVTCKSVSYSADKFGFSSIDWSSLKAKYDAGKGLLITAKARYSDGADFYPVTVKFRINQATKDVTIE
jgi:hypothetical protein